MQHIPVLIDQTVDAFSYLSKMGGNFVDGTLGLAGHSIAIAEAYGDSGLKFIGIDKDEIALKMAKKRITNAGLAPSFRFIHDDFSNIKSILANDLQPVGIFLDLGVSSLQLDDKSRGFSFEDPSAVIDMRMNQSQNKSAKDILNNYSESELIRILREYGEERHAKNIAYNICKHRKLKAFNLIGDLLGVLETSIPKSNQYKSKTHFATNTFRALRIETNEELSSLTRSLQDIVSIMRVGARLAVITFHSSEDRIVKHVFRELSKVCTCPENSPICICERKPKVKAVNKKPIVADSTEISFNPRSRSAKLRIIEKINE